MSILGHRVVRKEDPHLITGQGSYVDSVPLPGGLFVTFVRSPVAHAHLRGVDTTQAKGMPGVVDIVTAADIDFDDLSPAFPRMNAAMTRPPLARDRVRFVGEPFAAVVTDERAQGEDAAEAVLPDLDLLPPLVDPEAALESDLLLFPEAGSNVAMAFAFPPVEGLMDGADVVVSQRMIERRVAPVPIEPRTAAAEWDGSRLTFYASTQMPHGLRDTLARTLGLEPAAVRVVSSDVGGGFGAKGAAFPEELVVAWLARRLARPMRWFESRTENMLAMTHGRGQVQDVELGATADGRFVGLRLHVVQEAGAYAAIGSLLPYMTRLMASGVYDIPKVEFRGHSVVTNTTPVGAYRGAGRPEAAYAIERIVDVLADQLGIDPGELRRRNLVKPEAFPFRTPTGATYDIGDYEGALQRALAAAGYDQLLEEQRRRREEGAAKLLGIGLSCYVEVTNGMGSGEYGAVAVHHDGSATVRTGSQPHGQGHVTAWSMIASATLGIPMERIEVIHGDTDAVPSGGGTGGSRSLQAGGVAVHKASVEVVDQARRVAAEMLEAAVDDVVLNDENGRFHVVGSPSVSRGWSEVATGAPEPLAAGGHYEATGATFPFGAHVAVVEVDTDTGKVELTRMVACDDAGRIVNPMIVEGQVHGGLAQGIAQALLEEVVYDPDGNPLTTNLADYSAISARDLPFFETVAMETPTPLNVLGAKGIGESATIGSTPAVVNAVVDALSHLGIRHVDMPTTPERVWRALRGTAS